MTASLEPHDLPVCAIVTAAGRSQRMGEPKQLLDVGGRTLLESVLEPLLAAGLSTLFVVTRAEIAKRLGPRPGVQFVLNEDSHSAMIDSVRLGLRAWGASDAGAPGGGLLVCPGDHPEISIDDIKACIAAFRASPDHVVIATRSGRRGHPLIFPAADAALVTSPLCDGGLNALPRLIGSRVRLVECASPGVLHDIDTPADLELLRRRSAQRSSD